MRRQGLLLTIGRGLLRKVGAKRGRLGQTRGSSWRALAACQLSRQALRLGGLLRRRSKRGAALISSAGHDAAKVVGRAVADLRGRRRLVAAHGRMAAAGNIQLSAQSSDFGFVSG
jgi:hypothetical protein